MAEGLPVVAESRGYTVRITPPILALNITDSGDAAVCNIELPTSNFNLSQLKLELFFTQYSLIFFSVFCTRTHTILL